MEEHSLTSQAVASTIACDLTLFRMGHVQIIECAEQRSMLCCFWSDEIQRPVCWPEESPWNSSRRVHATLSSWASPLPCPVNLSGSFLRLFTFRMEIRTAWLPVPSASWRWESWRNPWRMLKPHSRVTQPSARWLYGWEHSILLSPLLLPAAASS